MCMHHVARCCIPHTQLSKATTHARNLPMCINTHEAWEDQRSADSWLSSSRNNQIIINVTIFKKLLHRLWGINYTNHNEPVFNDMSWGCSSQSEFCILTVKPFTPSADNLRQNLYRLVPAAPTQTLLFHHTYLAFFLEDDGFTRLLPFGLRAGRSLKRLSLVCGSNMLDLSLVTTTSSLPPISTVRKEIQKLWSGKPIASPGLFYTPCECDAKKFPGSTLCAVAGRDVDSLLGLRAVCCACELELECSREWRLPEHQHIIHTCPLPRTSVVTRPTRLMARQLPL